MNPGAVPPAVNPALPNAPEPVGKGIVDFVSGVVGIAFAYIVIVIIVHHGLRGYLVTVFGLAAAGGGISLLLHILLKSGWPWFAFLFAMFVVLLELLFWLIYVGSHSYLRDVLGILASVVIIVWIFPGPRDWLKARWARLWGQGANVAWEMEYGTRLCIWSSILAWIILSLLDVAFERTPLKSDIARFEKLPDGWPGLRIGLALSGGGYRAALLHAGVLHALEAKHLRVTNLSAVSGGSIIGAYYAGGGDPEDLVRALGGRVFLLERELAGAQNVLFMLPWLSWIDRTDVQANLVDRRLLRGWLVKEMNAPGHPRMILGATDLQGGLLVGMMGDGVLLHALPSPYDKQEFQDDQFGVLWAPPRFIPHSQGAFPRETDRVADLVATSGAFPFAFPPRRHRINVVPWGVAPSFKDKSRRSLSLVLSDGGLTDNYGFAFCSWTLTIWAARPDGSAGPGGSDKNHARNPEPERGLRPDRIGVAARSGARIGRWQDPEAGRGRRGLRFHEDHGLCLGINRSAT